MGFFFKYYLLWPLCSALLGVAISFQYKFDREKKKLNNLFFTKRLSNYIKFVSKLNLDTKSFLKLIPIFFLVIFYIIHGFMGLWLFWKVCILNQVYYYTLGTWINCGLFIVNFGFIFDSLSVSMLLTVSLVSICVHFYSLEYMDGDPNLHRFIAYLSLFTFFMFILVTADNLIQLFLGWEGIGLCSYLLISFWNTRVQANKAALKALIVNRVGDFGYLCGFLILYYFFRTVDFSVLFALAPFFFNKTVSIFGIEFFCLDVACLFLFIGSMGKSAQIGLHTWLPDAMEGPTPVSALIHAATLVTAGVFLIVRCSPIFEYASSVLFIIMLFGGLTAFFAATVAITQNDIKKVIAYSTCSQLGYMVFACGLSAYDVSMFHLVNHAFFKALLFLAAGVVIHNCQGEQDMRRFGSFIKLMPFAYTMMLIGFISLSGLPFLSGFYSKDLLLEVAYAKYNMSGVFTYWLGSLSAALTAFYSFRVFFISFLGNANSFKYYIKTIHEVPLNWISGYFSPLYLLSIGSIFSGYMLKDAFVGAGSVFWGNGIYISCEKSLGIDQEFISLIAKNIPLIFSLGGILLALQLTNILELKYVNEEKQIIDNLKTNKLILHYPQDWVGIITFLNKKWYFDYVYNYYIGCSILKHGYESFYKLLDKGFIEILGPQGLSFMIYKSVLILNKKQSGYIYHSGFLLIIWLFVFVYLVLTY